MLEWLDIGAIALMAEGFSSCSRWLIGVQRLSSITLSRFVPHFGSLGVNSRSRSMQSLFSRTTCMLFSRCHRMMQTSLRDGGALKDISAHGCSLLA
jgi:hypothetical protein